MNTSRRETRIKEMNINNLMMSSIRISMLCNKVHGEVIFDILKELMDCNYNESDFKHRIDNKNAIVEILISKPLILAVISKYSETARSNVLDFIENEYNYDDDISKTFYANV